MSDLEFGQLPSPRSIPGERLEQRRILLERHVAASLRSSPKRWWRRRRVLLPGTVVVVTCLAAAGWGLRPGGLADRASAVGCYSAVSLQSDTAVIGGAAAADPVGACLERWRRSGLESGGDAAACLRDDGGIAVFPRKDACGSLGLRPFAGVSDLGRRFAAFQHDAVSLVAADRCRPRAEIVADLRRALDSYGFSSWSVDDSGFGRPWARGRPCASLAFDQDRSAVVVVPFPDLRQK